MASYTMTVQDQTFELRLTAKAQAKLENKYKAGIVGLIFDAIDKAALRAELFTEALNYKGSKNPIGDGFDFCDALADDGVAGSENLAVILLNMAFASGIISETIRDKALAQLKGVFAEDETADGENPTTATA